MLIQLPELNAFKDIPGYKAILKAVIKSQIQFLVEQLSHQTGEESVLLTASISDGTLSHLGSESGKVFLETNDDFRSQFLGFCIKRHHSSVSKATVRKKPPTAKRSVPFGFNNNPKRQHTEVFPTAISKAVLANDEENKGPDAPDISTDLPPTNPAVERETLEETLQESSLENKEVASNDDAGSDETIENYPIVKQEPVDESDKSPGFDSSFDISLQNFDTSVTNGEMIVKSKNGKKLGLPSDDQNASFESEPNATMVKREYQDNDIMADEPGSSADDSLNMHEEAQSYNYGHSSGAVEEHQLFFSHAEPTPKILTQNLCYESTESKSTKRYQQRYSAEDMANALSAVRNNQMKKSEAAKYFGIPLTTLLDKLSGKSPEFRIYRRTEFGTSSAYTAPSKPTSSGKKVRPKRIYTREAMLSALDAVRSGKMTKREASIHFDVPYSTMADKLYGRTPE